MRATMRRDPYPTRTVEPAEILPRVDPVIHGDESGPLDPELLEAYEETGALVVPAAVPLRSVAAADAELARLAADEDARRRPEAIREPASDELRSLFAIHHEDGPLRELALHPFVVDVARQILGSEVYVHQSRVNLKPGFRGREFYWHSDFETWHAEDGMPRMRSLSCSILLTENHTWNAPLLTIPGSHRSFVGCQGPTPERNHERSLRRQEVGVPDDRALEALVADGGIQECTGPVGTCVFFDANVMHGSNGNITPLPRRNVFVVFNSVENALEEPFAAAEPRPEHIAARTFTPI